jgi:hypothetical protein
MTANHCTALPDCTAPATRKGLCNGHRLQQRKGKPFTPLQIRTTARDEQGRKWCPLGKHWTSPEDFTKCASRADGLEAYCANCRQFRTALRLYNITREDLLAMFERQGNACGICLKLFEGRDGWHVDHDHSCPCAKKQGSCGKCVRGLLCGLCNRGLGCFGDDVDRLRAAAVYLSR